MAEEQEVGRLAALAEEKLPVESLRAAVPHLRRPFTPEAVRWKVQVSLGGKENPTGALVVAHLDARLVVERLNAVCPHLWTEETSPAGQGAALCKLTIDGQTHSDIGVGSGPEALKAMWSDALKRAAVRFGVGVSIYALRSALLNVGDGEGQIRAKKKRQKVDGAFKDVFVPELDARSTAWLRTKYAGWLTSTGERMFGPALDHGDVLEAMGIEEGGDPEEAVAVVDGGEVEEKLPLTDERAEGLKGRIRMAFDVLREADPKAMMPAVYARKVRDAEHSYEELEALLVEMNGLVKAAKS